MWQAGGCLLARHLLAVRGSVSEQKNPPAPSSDDGWQRVAEQNDSLRAVLLSLLTLVASSAAPGQPQETLLNGDEQGSLRGVSEGPLMQKSAAMVVSEGPSAITAVVKPPSWAQLRVRGLSPPFWRSRMVHV
ncbi:unnamed protein product [Lampetra planeri]